MSNTAIDKIIESLQPSMAEYADNSNFHYWMDYACELDILTLMNFKDEDLVTYINKRIKDKFDADPEHHACVDVAACIETHFAEYSGKFVYV
jgi:hypothetical protein